MFLLTRTLPSCIGWCRRWAAPTVRSKSGRGGSAIDMAIAAFVEDPVQGFGRPHRVDGARGDLAAPPGTMTCGWPFCPAQMDGAEVSVPLVCLAGSGGPWRAGAPVWCRADRAASISAIGVNSCGSFLYSSRRLFRTHGGVLVGRGIRRSRVGRCVHRHGCILRPVGGQLTALDEEPGGELTPTFGACYIKGDPREEIVADWVRNYSDHSENVPRIGRLPVGKLTHNEKLFTAAEKRSSLMYNEFQPKYDCQDQLAVVSTDLWWPASRRGF